MARIPQRLWLIAATVLACTPPSSISLNDMSLWPNPVYVGEYFSFTGSGSSDTALTAFIALNCTVRVYQDGYEYHSGDSIPCWILPNKQDTTRITIGTKQVWLPNFAPLGQYTWEVTVTGPVSGCWSGNVNVMQDPTPGRISCNPSSEISLNFKDWASRPLIVQQPFTVLAEGLNMQSLPLDWTHCIFEIFTTSYSFNTQSTYLPCHVTQLSDNSFQLETAVISLPMDMHTGEYNWVLTVYPEKGPAAACGFGQVTVLSCNNDGTVTLNTESWMPETPFQGFPSSLRLQGQNNREETISVRSVAVTLVETGGSGATFSTPLGVEASSGLIAPGASMNFLTDAIWIPPTLPAGEYTSYVTAFDPNSNSLGCYSGKFTLHKAPWDTPVRTCTPGVFSGHIETWVPNRLQRGGASYVVVSGVNSGPLQASSNTCSVTLTQGSYSYRSRGRVACGTGLVAAGQDFHLHTALVWVPYDAPFGVYSTEIQAYDSTGVAVGCWSGTVVITDPSKPRVANS